ncbi:MAG: c-type cytochrome [Phycisphaerae bacterium]|nr:c-type cytochrome [Phycisphaerae bacterium]
MDLANIMPLPRDIPLPLPADRVVLEALLVLLFLAHILFVNLMVGGSILALATAIAGRTRPDYDRLAREITKTITVNKSLAVVIGVAPLLVVNVMYTLYFYSANALTGHAWISIVPLLTLAFLLAYAYKYGWDRLSGLRSLHFALGAGAVALFLAIPLIFLSNINLMLFPAKWTQVKGFFSTLLLPNVLPRYLHFVVACLGVASLFLLGYLTRKGFPVESTFERLDRPALRRLFYGIALASTAMQFSAGPLVYFTLPDDGITWPMIIVILIGITLAATATWLLFREVIAPADVIGRRFVPIVTLLMCTVFCMGYARHLYREAAIRDHRLAMAQRTQDHQWAVAAAASDTFAGRDPFADLPPGERLYRQACSGCHVPDRTVVGPPLTEIAELYRDNPAGIVTWTHAPQRKRPGFPPMPAFRLPDESLQAVAEYMIRTGLEHTER